MNTIRICGGVGNQLFQYAFGKAQKARGIKVNYDISWYDKYQIPERPFLLNKFNLDLDLDKTQSKQYLRIRKEKGFNSKEMFDIGFRYVGYWQSPLYHKEIYSELIKEIRVKESFYTKEFLNLRKKILISNAVSIHIRHGDYLNKKNHLVLPLEYYINALRILTSLKGSYEIFVFSDDIKWCMEKFSNAYFVQLEDYLELELMSLCKHNIIANSTFSWWAAYLNKNIDKIVIAPKKWVVKKEDQELIDRKKLILHDWIKL